MPATPAGGVPIAAGSGIGPVETHERESLLDVLRGFAVFGILIANTNRGAYTPFLIASSFDRTVIDVLEIFARDKFWPLFAFLFGVGFAIQVERAEARGAGIVAPYLRRLAALGAIGCVLGLLVDVPQLLHLAVAGVPMMLIGLATRRRPLSWLAAIALSLCVASLGLSTARGMARAGLPIPRDEAAVRLQQFLARAEREQARDASWSLDRLGSHARSALESYRDLPADLAGARGLHQFLLFYMLLGTVGWRGRPRRGGTLDRDTCSTLLGVSLPVGLAAAAFAHDVQQASTLARFGLAAEPSHPSLLLLPSIRVLASVAMDTAYVAGITLVLRSRRGGSVARALAPAGRMALTNYVLQAVLPAVLFGYYTPGIPAIRLGSVQRLALLCGIFGVQVVFSRAWLRRWRFGPLEWLLRSLTYWRRQPMTRAKAA
jgi:uncharacterized protein